MIGKGLTHQGQSQIGGMVRIGNVEAPQPNAPKDWEIPMPDHGKDW